MTIQEVVKLIADNSITVIVIAYLLFKDYTTTRLVIDSLTKLNDTVELLKDLLITKKE